MIKKLYRNNKKDNFSFKKKNKLEKYSFNSYNYKKNCNKNKNQREINKFLVKLKTN